MKVSKGNQERVVKDYDRNMVQPIFKEYYGNSDYFNLGYWTIETMDQAQASDNLTAVVLGCIPELKGTILDVACGMGATTRHLLKYYPPEAITGINYSGPQLAKARVNAPGVKFIRMDATELEFPNESFDNIICLEAAFHFQTRETFYREALRVLKPGGRLVTSDILGPEIIWPGNSVKGGPEGLRSCLEKAGFVDAQVWDRTLECRDGFKNNIQRWPLRELKAKRINLLKYLYLCLYAGLRTVVGTYITTFYVITSAQKPQAAAQSINGSEEKETNS